MMQQARPVAMPILTPPVVARLGFKIMNTTWSYLKTNTSDEINDALANQMIDNISSHFEKQLKTFVTVEKKIQNLTKQANALLRTAEKLNTRTHGLVTRPHALTTSHDVLHHLSS